ncbi:MAG TPA: type II toxin-antitoxin system prevent-host-death family antitoxin [Methylomirabilota bacterium]|jgi:prevent-host-death family protein|nr:type II toxin-antitoxin system prevent-host-death family antitoxin [Methylomirabilota bacterium]
MKRARIAELKNNLSRYLEHVKSGGTVLVLARDQPVARIIPVQRTAAGHGGDDEERLRRLERRGLIRRGAGGLPEWLGKRKPPKLRGSVLRDLLDERHSRW